MERAESAVPWVAREGGESSGGDWYAQKEGPQKERAGDRRVLPASDT